MTVMRKMRLNELWVGSWGPDLERMMGFAKSKLREGVGERVVSRQVNSGRLGKLKIVRNARTFYCIGG